MENQTVGEEIFNSITHGIGAVCALAGFVFVEIIALKKSGFAQIISLNVYGLTLFLLFLFSTLSHGIQAKGAKRVLQLFDHLCIYLLVAGTYTPLLSLLFKKHLQTGIVLLIVIWSIALIGIMQKIFLIHNTKYAVFDLLFYILMGWFAVFILPEMKSVLNQNTLILLFIGGVLYTVGTIFFRWHRLKFHHAYWHLFVLFGSAVHYVAIIKTMI